jgi:hypothetical protein
MTQGEFSAAGCGASVAPCGALKAGGDGLKAWLGARCRAGENPLFRFGRVRASDGAFASERGDFTGQLSGLPHSAWSSHEPSTVPRRRDGDLTSQYATNDPRTRSIKLIEGRRFNANAVRDCDRENRDHTLPRHGIPIRLETPSGGLPQFASKPRAQRLPTIEPI